MANRSACAFRVSEDMSYSAGSRVVGRLAKRDGSYLGNECRNRQPLRSQCDGRVKAYCVSVQALVVGWFCSVQAFGSATVSFT